MVAQVTFRGIVLVLLILTVALCGCSDPPPPATWDAFGGIRAIQCGESVWVFIECDRWQERSPMASPNRGRIRKLHQAVQFELPDQFTTDLAEATIPLAQDLTDFFCYDGEIVAQQRDGMVNFAWTPEGFTVDERAFADESHREAAHEVRLDTEYRLVVDVGGKELTVTRDVGQNRINISLEGRVRMTVSPDGTVERTDGTSIREGEKPGAEPGATP